LNATYNQKIDHDNPYRIAILEYPGEATVGAVVPLTIRLDDKYGNPVDNRHIAEQLHLEVGSPSGTPAEGLAGFSNGGSYVQNISAPVNENGAVFLTMKLAAKTGSNIVLIESLGSIQETYFTITGVGDTTPYSIERTIAPSAGWQYADGKSTFGIDYRLLDKFGNGIRNSVIRVATTSPGDSPLNLTTNEAGEVSIIYGPKDTVGVFDITATAQDNSTLSCTDVLEFISTSASDMVLTASPQTMASRDADPAIVSDLMGKVMDAKGNPVQGENVTFQILSTTYQGTYNITSEPYLDSTTAQSDSDGFATVHFIPGAFTANENDPLYNQIASGSAAVRATWLKQGSIPVARDVTLTWKNYPYLSVVTTVSPSTAAVNDTVDITIRLIGDGYLMKPKPVDVILAVDRSGSMSTKDMEDSAGHPNSVTRLHAAQAAATNFVESMNQTSDRIGLVSYSTSASVPNPLGNQFTSVKTNINTLTAGGYTATRDALQQSIKNLIGNPNSDPRAIKAVIIMTDGEFNYYGDPLARGTGSSHYAWWTTYTDRYYYYSGLGGTMSNGGGIQTNQDMTLYAKNNNIRIYTISFSNDIMPGSATWTVMDTLAQGTNGIHYHAVSSSQLNEVYNDIAGKLRTEAGVNTVMNINLGTVKVNDQLFNGSEVLDYMYQDGVSSRIVWPNSTVTTIDQTSQWETSHNLIFNVGTVRLNEVWQGTLRFRVLKAGNIDIFGDNSRIVFNNGTDSLMLPRTFLTAVPVLDNAGVNFMGLSLSNLTATLSSPDQIDVSWNLNYTGTRMATEDISYSIDGRPWKHWDSLSDSSGFYYERVRLDLRQIPRAGQYYSIRITAWGEDGGWDRQETLPVPVGNQQLAFIKLE
jgi:hypothetical protein